ncbi:MAG: hypothetical protein NZ937_07530 [Armatimonadetes bacterium]|nr:hypothetical protein [Armatimonadota bacterium]
MKPAQNLRADFIRYNGYRRMNSALSLFVINHWLKPVAWVNEHQKTL